MKESHDENYKHRDLDWLNFNKRVLQEAQDSVNPLYERIKFLAIFSSNLDEYFRVRVSQLRQIKKVKKSLRKKLVFKPNKKVKQILTEVKSMQADFGRVFYEMIIPDLARNGIFLLNEKDYNREQINETKQLFQKTLKPKLVPQIISFEEKKPVFLKNDTIYFLVNFKEDNHAGLVNIPFPDFGRFYVFNDKSKGYFITFIDDVIRMMMTDVFPGEQIEGIYEVKMSRDAELYIEDKYDGELAEKIYDSLAQRTNGQPTRLLYDAAIPQNTLKALRKHLQLGKVDLMPGGRYHNFSDFFDFPIPKNKLDLKKEELDPLKHKAFLNQEDYFKVVKDKDVLVHFPYMDFEVVENFLEQAAKDHSVTDIKISLYRVADESKLTSSLIKAIKNGITVTVFIEAKARFDEENNIIWGRKFEKLGAKVIYSYPKIKVHSKVFLINRIENGEKCRYAYIGTGNFNSETSKIYCDHGIFTAQEKATKELDRLFKVLEGELIIPRANHLLISPFNTRRTFTQLILQEIDHAQAGNEAKIEAKLNSLEDQEIINLLYRASQSGVKVRLLVRGFTCLRAGVKGLSENIYITSILDNYLEHGRIYIFHNNGNPKMYMGSADWMERNLDRRIEVLLPIIDASIFKELREILNLQFQDNQKARIQDYLEDNRYVAQAQGEKPIRSQVKIYSYLKEKHKA